MGAIGEEELMKWENMQGLARGHEEKILVLVRLRPLSEKESARNEVADWECINETTILYRNSLQERSGLPTAYTFDGVFGGDCSTKHVYEEGTKEIALSVVSGINSTIFAYGQTSSGKTYTMNGITEYTVADIYDYIQRHEERAFVLKFSAIEIYNEVVRDLLGRDDTQLRLLDDPEKGTIVEKLAEETLRDWSHLRELLSICEAQRQIGETSLNETSSRSHQILRLTIESSAREFLGKDKSTTLSASVNFVDLAGSERASQALSVGQRLKEGCHINRSLLTLGTVIRKLSKGRHGHVNYRDSKLTRILQPSLGGNARTAIICTLSPARSHVEQSRNTLLFATCAKEVTTNAQVNIVMSDKALVKHLQKEVARLETELRTPGPACDYAALLRKKDLQIEKLEKELRELTKQRDLAQSRVEDLLRGVRNDHSSGQWDELSHNAKFQEKNTWEDESSVSEASCGTDRHCLDVAVKKKKFNDATQSSNKNNRRLSEDEGDHSLFGGTSSSLSDSRNFGRSDRCRGKEEFVLETGESSDDICKEVRCIEHEERAFVLKFSAIEIYNEVVRDLLGRDDTQLRLLDDPEKGTIVEKLAEETLRDWSHLRELLSICEAQRQIGETSLNETSSRSHQILRLTIESSAREFLGKDKSTTLSASVNFVDLAGSERASQALSVGQRLKEGCHINRSLLTLGTNFVDLAGSERASQALSVGQRLKEGCHINRSLLTLGTVIRKLRLTRYSFLYSLKLQLAA
ncbi:unnamed protein product [Ilex paraguariensis]|uniref:Kinesin-like protein n=1 Tax=Ilex paraguariensis TaxID=185542 RepID=A0ABC8RAT0_9AQUA